MHHKLSNLLLAASTVNQNEVFQGGVPSKGAALVSGGCTAPARLWCVTSLMVVGL